jgi:hypothetical protein
MIQSDNLIQSHERLNHRFILVSKIEAIHSNIDAFYGPIIYYKKLITIVIFCHRKSENRRHRRHRNNYHRCYLNPKMKNDCCYCCLKEYNFCCCCRSNSCFLSLRMNVSNLEKKLTVEQRKLRCVNNRLNCRYRTVWNKFWVCCRKEYRSLIQMSFENYRQSICLL